MKPLRVFLCGLVVLLCMAGICSAVTYDPYEIQPKLPMGIGGTVYINGELAPVGTVITATGQNVGIGFLDNPLTLDRNPFGGFCEFKLTVQGTPTKWIDPNAPAGQYAIPDGSPLKILVNGEPAKIRFYETTEWLDRIPYNSGDTPKIYIAAGTVPDIVEVDPGASMTFDTYQGIWDKSEQKRVDALLASRWSRVETIGTYVDSFKTGSWRNIVYPLNQENFDKASPGMKDAINRQITYAEYGGYVYTGPNLDAMLEAQGWKDLKSSYGIEYKEEGWIRWDFDTYGKYWPPSLYVPPQHVVDALVKQAPIGYRSMADQMRKDVQLTPPPKPEPTVIPTAAPTPVPTTIPTTIIPTVKPTVIPTAAKYSAIWDADEQAEINKMLSDPHFLVRSFGMKLNTYIKYWWNPGKKINYNNVNSDGVQAAISRQIAFAESGGYQAGPDLEAMIEGLNSYYVDRYGSAMDIRKLGIDVSDRGWTMWDSTEYRRYNPPSWFIPPA
jgi:hypothetical protein